MTGHLPQYGELATPEEQRRAAGLPPIDADTVPAVATPTPDPVAPPRDSSRVGRIVTFALLGFGLINVFSSLAGLMDLSTTMARTMEILGIDGTFTAYAAARTWGVIAAVVLLGGYALTVWLSLRRVKARRSSWWVPLLGFVVTTIGVSICISVPMFADPVFTHGLRALAG